MNALTNPSMTGIAPSSQMRTAQKKESGIALHVTVTPTCGALMLERVPLVRAFSNVIQAASSLIPRQSSV